MKKPDSPCLKEARRLGFKDCPNRSAECHIKGNCKVWDEYTDYKEKYQSEQKAKIRGSFRRRYDT